MSLQQGIAICSRVHGGEMDVKNTVCINSMIEYLNMQSYYARHPRD